jgi:hypothetical protein
MIVDENGMCTLSEEDCSYQSHTAKRTNADRIRSMSDEELAELLTAVAQKSASKLCESLKTVEVDLSNCNFHILYEAHLDWLKQEAKE